jgi:hypothetical protein
MASIPPIRQRQFVAESFANAVLAGSVLQVAAKAIEVYSTNTNVSNDWKVVIGKSRAPIPFCIGRMVRGVPTGLVIYGGRNQHMHYNEAALQPVNREIFARMAAYSEHEELKGFVDPGLDLTNPLLDSFASNVLYVLGWKSYNDYIADMKVLLP